MALASPLVASPVRKLRLAALARWWHLLSLDAPSVAALWSWTIAMAIGVRLPWTAPLLLACGTWLIYVADRILDGKSADLAAMRERHFFYARHRVAFLIASIPVGVLLLWLIFARMNPAARRDDIVMFAAALIYLAAIHICGADAESWLPKELTVGVVFAAATAIPAWSRLAQPHLASHRSILILTVLFFAAICWLNCAAIEKWERARDYSNEVSLPHRSTRWAQRRFQRICIGLLLTAVAAGVICWILDLPPAAVALFVACALSAAGLAGLDFGQQRIRMSGFHLRVAADVAMLTPLLFILVLR